MPVLRPFQAKSEQDIYNAWNDRNKVVGLVSPTGSGKTTVFTKILNDYSGVRCAIAHRQELVSQMSIALGRNGVRHNIIAPDKVRRMIVSMQILELGTSYYDRNSKLHVAGVDTFNLLDDAPWMKQCGLVVPDEAHHVLRENKWGQAVIRLPNAYGLFPSATFCRADGKGLGRHADGFVDTLVFAPYMREVINMGYLTDYRIVCAESDIVMTDDDISSTTGDFNMHKLREKHKNSRHIVGDVVKAYLQFAKGMTGITFAVDIEEAAKIAQAFRAAGVPAEVVSGKTPDDLRTAILQRLKNKEILQVVNVDLFGEGVDVPAIQVVSFARHTMSFSLYAQQFGRALRLLIDGSYMRLVGGVPYYDTLTNEQRRAIIAQSAKPKALIIDHVGNVLRHLGPPDAEQNNLRQTLDRRERRGGKKSDAIPWRYCLSEQCLQPYERIYKCCPYCGTYPPIPARNDPVYVDGDMTELDEDFLRMMRGEIAKKQNFCAIPANATPEIEGRLRRVHWEKQQVHAQLRNAVDWWAGLQNAQGRNDSQAYRLFFHKFGIDTLSMQLLDKAEATELYSRVAGELAKYGIDATQNAAMALTQH
jgi:superfamily II DNA or RNA helicase